MIVTCESCQARFRLDDSKVGPEGAKVRCSKCSHTFVVKRVAPAPATVSPRDIQPLDEDEDTKVTGPAATVAATNTLPPMPTPAPPLATPTAPGPSTLEPNEIHVEVGGLEETTDPNQAPTRDLKAEARAARAEVDSIHRVETKVHTVPNLVSQTGPATEAVAQEAHEDPFANIDPFNEAQAEGSHDPAPPSNGGLENLFSDIDTDDSHSGAFDSFEGADASPEPELSAPVATGGDEAQASAAGRAVIYLLLAASFLLMGSGVVYFVSSATGGLLGPKRVVVPKRHGIIVSSVRAVHYPTAKGQALVVTGEVLHRGVEPLANPYVFVELRNAEGAAQGEQGAPLGVVLSPQELESLSGPSGLEAIWQREAAGPRTLAPDQKQPYMVLFLQPPAGAQELTYHLRVAEGAVIAAPAAPEPTPAELVAAPEDQLEDDDALRKGKKKQRKTKRKRRGKRGKVKK